MVWLHALKGAYPAGMGFRAGLSGRLYGDVSGWSDCLGRRGGTINPARLAATRDEALAAASAVIRGRLPDKPIADWLESLAPDQPDLFGGAA